MSARFVVRKKIFFSKHYRMMVMGFISLFFIVFATKNAVLANNSTKDYLDPYDAEDNLIIVKSLFGKLNTLLNDTNGITQSLLDLNHRLEGVSHRLEDVSHKFEDLNKRQDDHENRVKSILENVQLDLNKRLDTQRNLITKYLNQTQTWHTILRRQDGSENFNRTWNEYKNGFGNSNGEFFIGLERLHAMTTYGPPQELLVVLKDFENQMRYAKYDLFRIGSEAEKYAIMELGEYSGDAGDSLREHKGQKFSTPDQDNDAKSNYNCAQGWASGWWFRTCYRCNLNGLYRNESELLKDGVDWISWKGLKNSLKYAEMMIR